MRLLYSLSHDALESLTELRCSVMTAAEHQLLQQAAIARSWTGGEIIDSSAPRHLHYIALCCTVMLQIPCIKCAPQRVSVCSEAHRQALGPW